MIVILLCFLKHLVRILEWIIGKQCQITDCQGLFMMGNFEL